MAAVGSSSLNISFFDYSRAIQFSRISHPGHKGMNVFFYLSMENQRLWKPVLGYEYVSNAEFEAAMKTAYLAKINQRM